MGFKFQKPKPCPLSPEQLTLSLLYNQNFIPGRSGTKLAIGSIVEPFQPELKSLTISYIAELAKLGNPIQFSTKSHLTTAETRMISSSCSWVSPLITILTMNESKARVLEPLAPTAAKRLDTIRNLAEEGLKPFLFLRPILPGIVTLEEYTDLINETVNHGAKGIVLGNFRVTERIIDALKRKKLDVSEIIKRSRIIDGRQRAIHVSDIQEKIEGRFSPLIKTYRRSCCASAYCADQEHCVHETAHGHTGR
jgi:DNA repair photolyase